MPLRPAIFVLGNAVFLEGNGSSRARVILLGNAVDSSNEGLYAAASASGCPIALALSVRPPFARAEIAVTDGRGPGSPVGAGHHSVWIDNLGISLSEQAGYLASSCVDEPVGDLI